LLLWLKPDLVSLLQVAGIHCVWKLLLLHHPSIFDSVLLSLPADVKETIRAKLKMYLSAPDPRLLDQSMMGSTIMLATMVLEWLNSGGGAGDGREKRVGDKDILVMAGPDWDLCAGAVDSAVHMEYFVDGHRKPKESFRCGRSVRRSPLFSQALASTDSMPNLLSFQMPLRLLLLSRYLNRPNMSLVQQSGSWLFPFSFSEHQKKYFPLCPSNRRAYR
jgi:hypothetical protein